MPTIRFRIRTIMIAIAAVAALLGLLRLALQYDDTLTLGFIVVLIGWFGCSGWLLNKRARQLSTARSSSREASQGRGARESVGPN
jgi:small-conductance mechanosensitive channel